MIDRVMGYYLKVHILWMIQANYSWNWPGGFIRRLFNLFMTDEWLTLSDGNSSLDPLILGSDKKKVQEIKQ
jgi:hypothetical protein